MRRPRLVLLLVLGMLTALLPLGAAPAVAADDHLLMTEIVVTPTEGEFVEIHNPTASAIDLTDYYFTDATFAWPHLLLQHRDRLERRWWWVW